MIDSKQLVHIQQVQELLDLADFTLQEQPENNCLMVAISNDHDR